MNKLSTVAAISVQPSRKTGARSRVYLCYQCKKCSSGCPVSFAMDLLPHQVMRLTQLEENRKVLDARTIWVCASCLVCSTRCPNDIDIAGVMDEFRHLAAHRGEISEKRIVSFHRIFLGEVRRFGRVHELSLIAKYKLLSGQWFQDAVMGMKLFAKRKLKIFPNWIKGRKEVARLFQQTREGP